VNGIWTNLRVENVRFEYSDNIDALRIYIQDVKVDDTGEVAPKYKFR
jgi:hypothetical protein